MNNMPFSKELSSWLRGAHSKTLGSLDEVFGRRSFAIAFILLLSPSALPIPTGGITNIFEVIAFILAAELIIGRDTIWLPKKWTKIRLNKSFSGKALPKLISFIAWFEKFSKQRKVVLPSNKFFYRISGLLIAVFTTLAFVSPPFSMLDTLPSLGVVIIALAIITEDLFMYIFGLLVGSIGAVLLFTLGSAAFHLFTRFI